MKSSRIVSFLTFSALVAAALQLAGCDPIKDEGAESGGSEESGSSGDPEPTTGETTDPPALVSHAGEACVTERASQACGDGEREGFEICMATVPGGEDLVWSECLVEPCKVFEATRPCSDAEGKPGVERCIELPDMAPLYWGRCAPEVCSVGFEDCETRQTCVLDLTGATVWKDNGGAWSDKCDTPLVLQFGEQAPEFSPAPVSAAAFDISGVGRCTANDWPTAATPWLVRDLDRSGDIEGGHELFGSGTVLASGRRAAHGFEALAELDADGDRKISAADAAWSELLVWADSDGDRVATGWELVPLSAYGVAELPLEFEVAATCDERGNCGRERAAITHRVAGAAAAGQLVDVHVVCE
jgi:hypothetical protein